MSVVQTQQPVLDHGTPAGTAQITIYSHSGLFYWWPVWAIGYLLALITYVQGHLVNLGDAEVIIHPSKNLGVIFMVITVLVILITNVTVRGVGSLTVIIAILAVTFLFAYLGWWDDIFHAVSFLALYMNLGFYIFFSSVIFFIWAMAFFLFDRLEFYKFRPGQMEHYSVFGGGEQTYDTGGMALHKLRDDLFRHWILGLGSGDLQVSTAGAVRKEFTVRNVLFVGRKLSQIQSMIAMKPDETPNVITAGSPQ